MATINKLTDFIKGTLSKLNKKRYSKMTMKVVIFYFAFIVLLLLTWYTAWIFMFAKSGTADLDALSKFIIICTGATGFFGFIIECFIDKNHNGIPDMYEGDKKPMPYKEIRK